MMCVVNDHEILWNAMTWQGPAPGEAAPVVPDGDSAPHAGIPSQAAMATNRSSSLILTSPFPNAQSV